MTSDSDRACELEASTIDLGLAHMPTQRLVMDSEIVSDMPHWPTGLDRQPHTALDQLS